MLYLYGSRCLYYIYMVIVIYVIFMLYLYGSRCLYYIYMVIVDYIIFIW